MSLKNLIFLEQRLLIFKKLTYLILKRFFFYTFELFMILSK